MVEITGTLKIVLLIILPAQNMICCENLWTGLLKMLQHEKIGESGIATMKKFKW